MAARRLLATTALLAITVSALTACDPDSPGQDAAASPSATASATAAAAPTGSAGATAATPGGSHSAKASKPASPKGSTTPASPAADCTAAAQHPGHKVINATAATADRLTATATKFVCGPEVDDDGYYEPAGASAPYSFAPGAAAELVTMGASTPSHAVPISALVQHINDCAAHREVAAPYNCFGGNYDITVDSAGHITKIVELFHP